MEVIDVQKEVARFANARMMSLSSTIKFRRHPLPMLMNPLTHGWLAD
jgi:hypothetical protein